MRITASSDNREHTVNETYQNFSFTPRAGSFWSLNTAETKNILSFCTYKNKNIQWKIKNEWSEDKDQWTLFLVKMKRQGLPIFCYGSNYTFLSFCVRLCAFIVESFRTKILSRKVKSLHSWIWRMVSRLKAIIFLIFSHEIELGQRR